MNTKVVSSNPILGEVYSIQLYVIKFSLTCNRSVVFSFSPGILVSSTDKTDHDITEILLKVALNTIFLTPNHQIAKNQIINT
jgi:hypothetical protein